MLCAAESDPFQGQNYRIAAVIHESILCPILNKLTVYMFATPQSIQYSIKLKGETTTTPTTIRPHQQQQYEKLTFKSSMENPSTTPTSSSSSSAAAAAKLKISQKQQFQHIPPTISNKLFIHEDASTSQLIHRNIPSNNSSISSSSRRDTTTTTTTTITHPLQHQHHHHLPHLQDEDATAGPDYILDQDEIEVVMPPTPAEYRMPTTKID